MTTTISGQSPDIQTVPRVFAWLERDQDGFPVVKIDDARGQLIEIQGVTGRDLLQLAQQALTLWRDWTPAGATAAKPPAQTTDGA
jgi:hypothetical protein